MCGMTLEGERVASSASRQWSASRSTPPAMSCPFEVRPGLCFGDHTVVADRPDLRMDRANLTCSW